MSKFQNIKMKIMADVISAVTVLEVDEKINLEGTLMIYIKTNDLNTVDENKFYSLAKKYSDNKFQITCLIPENIISDNLTIENKNTLCVFIEKTDQ